MTGPTPVAFDESLQPVPVPLVGMRRAVFVAPLKKRINESRERLTENFGLLWLREQRLVAFERYAFVAAEIDLATVERDEPTIARRTKPRLWKLLHNKTSRLFERKQ